MARPAELARVEPFNVPLLNWRITDLRDEPLRRQRVSQKLWTDVIKRELEERAIPARDLLCSARVKNRDRDRLAEKLEDERTRNPDITIKEIEDRGDLVEKPEDVDVRLRQVFLAVADATTRDIVGGISLTNLRPLVTTSQNNFDARGIVLCGVPPVGTRNQIQTWRVLLRRLMNTPMTLRNGREFNLMEWTAFEGSTRKSDLSTRRLFDALANDFDIVGSLDEPGPVRVRRRLVAPARRG